MNSLPRLLGISVLLLLGLVGAGLAARAWLQAQTAQIRTDLIEEKRRQFTALLAALPVDPKAPGFDRTMPVQAQLLGARISVAQLHPVDGPSTGELEFDQALHPLAPQDGTARVAFPMPAGLRQALVNERLLLGLVIVVPAGAPAPWRRAPPRSAPRPARWSTWPRPPSRRERP
jgi:hypothetical protein